LLSCNPSIVKNNSVNEKWFHKFFKDALSQPKSRQTKSFQDAILPNYLKDFQGDHANEILKQISNYEDLAIPLGKILKEPVMKDAKSFMENLFSADSSDEDNIRVNALISCLIAEEKLVIRPILSLVRERHNIRNRLDELRNCMVFAMFATPLSLFLLAQFVINAVNQQLDRSGKEIIAQLKPTTTKQSNIQPQPSPSPEHPTTETYQPSKYTEFKSQLQTALVKKDWRSADRYTKEIIYKGNAGISSDEVKEFSCEILIEIDQLWSESSGGKLGFNAQKTVMWDINENIIKDSGSRLNDGAKRTFFQKIGWKISKKSPILADYANLETDLSKMRTGYWPARAIAKGDAPENAEGWWYADGLLGRFHQCKVDSEKAK
jgi:GUN4-like